jgi:hypothetical protein
MNHFFRYPSLGLGFGNLQQLPCWSVFVSFFQPSVWSSPLSVRMDFKTISLSHPLPKPLPVTQPPQTISEATQCVNVFLALQSIPKEVWWRYAGFPLNNAISHQHDFHINKFHKGHSPFACIYQPISNVATCFLIIHKGPSL